MGLESGLRLGRSSGHHEPPSALARVRVGMRGCLVRVGVRVRVRAGVRVRVRMVSIPAQRRWRGPSWHPRAAWVPG